ncbi:endonuclease/exonuclease/phosphatase family protein [Photobacterium sp. SDRW27]|uniref:endonuclease/exonuclease/phosphatase family protein n=1 Tax=Photobacterium obscurum TaxID=2829490 RepID=UPI00224453EB|nr:endonuclease/exonuclease/phosphatase family protein [Photobacterium obscurum]MCW8328574.1 endonuclease/exonuclease/phosphatase family protein [Photobacterium obscurum]
MANHQTTKRLPQDSPSPLIIVSWNMQWLAWPDKSITIPRTPGDYRRLANIISELSPDVLAFQEVDSIEAIQAILPRTGYKVFLSDRHKNRNEQFPQQNQFTGFAVKGSLRVTDAPDLETLNVSHGKRTRKLRYGSYLIIHTAPDTKLHLLNVHLKSGCFSRKYKQGSQSCRTLRQQGAILASWIQQRQSNYEDFLIVGDFNHQLNSKQQWLLSSLNDALPQTVSNLTNGLTALCKVRHTNRDGTKEIRYYKSLIDHALSSVQISLKTRQYGQVYQYQFSNHLIERYQLSDHCPLVLHIPTMKR